MDLRKRYLNMNKRDYLASTAHVPMHKDMHIDIST